MNFHEGDQVMHWTYGLGKIVALEERTLSGAKTLYYAVQVKDLTIWVPSDANLSNRLRHPTSASRFRKLRDILSSPGMPLPDDRQARRLQLREMLKDGRAESLCQIIRDLTAYQKSRPLNDNDQVVLKEARNALLGEWGFALSITHAQAELELHRILTAGAPEIEG